MTERPWGRMTDEERQSWSAEIAATERAEQDLPPKASAEVHRKVAAILASASQRSATNVAEFSVVEVGSLAAGGDTEKNGAR